MKKEERKRVAKLVFNRLTDIRVGAVSVVTRGANMEPIQIIKNNKDESVNLKEHVSRYLRKDAGAEVTEEPTVAAVFVKEEFLPAVREVIGEKGILKEEKGAVIINKTEFGETDILKLDENVAIAVPGLSKAFESWTWEADFGANLATEGFYPSLRIAEEALYEAIYNAMSAAEPGTAPTEAVNAILTDFSAYVVTLIQAVPVEAFKFEGLTVPVEADTEEVTEQVVYKAEDVAALVKSVTDEGTILRGLVETLTEIAKTGAAEVSAMRTDVDALKSEVEVLGNTSESTSAGDQAAPKKKSEKGVFDSALNLPGF